MDRTPAPPTIDPGGEIPVPASFASKPTFVVSALECAEHVPDDHCRYQVAWSINPHMRIGAVEFLRARAQHRAFTDALGRAGARLVEIPFVHGAFDCVFSKDPALLLEREGVKRAVLARPRHRERQAEVLARASAYRASGFDVLSDADEPTWEGGDVVMLPATRGMLLGYGQRSSHSAAAWLHRRTGVRVTALELCDPRLYHLDMALAVLPDGTALVSDSALTDQARADLERTSGITSVVSVPRADALAFGLNLVAVGNTIISGAPVPRVEAICRSRGFRTVTTPLDQFHLAGGGAACLVARVHRQETRETRAPRAPPRERPMDVYGFFFRSVLFPFWERGLRRRPILKRWEELKGSQWMSEDELHAMQGRGLARLVRHAYEHVPFYRSRMDEAGIAPDDIRGPEDLWKIPIVDRMELRKSNEARRSTAPPFPVLLKQTSGTTGEPLVFAYEPDSEYWRRAVRLRGYEWAGFRPGDRALFFWGAPAPTRPSIGKRAKIALDHYLKRERHELCAVLGDARLRELVAAIERERPRIVICYAQAGAELARYVNRNGLRSWGTLPVICGAERLLPRDRADLEEAFGPAVFETYGCREVMLIAAECEAHEGMHVSMENLVVEIVVREDGRLRPAREGESGEVVFTDLHNFGMPFIRYANGDIAAQGPRQRCSCGRSLARLESVQGRTSELLRSGSGTPVSGLALSFLVQDLSPALRQFQAVQHKDRSVTINVVLDEPVPRAALEEVKRNGARLLEGVGITVQAVTSLPRSPAGKHQLVIVEHD